MAFDFDKIIERRGSNSIKWARHGRDTLPLWVADMDFRAPEPLLEALRRVVDHGVLGYDSAPRSLLETVAARMERLHGWKVDPDWVVPVTGVVSGFYAAISATCGPGRKAHVIQPPVYMPFNDLERHLGSPRREAPLEMETAREGSGAAPPSIEYNINWDIFDMAFDPRNPAGAEAGRGAGEAGAFLLCSPHNPIGAVWTEAELLRMSRTAISRGAVLVSDEIHSEILLGGARHRPAAALDPEIERRSITLVSPSKTFNMAGLFCGFAIIPDPALRRFYSETLERMTLHVSGPSLAAAEAAFSGACDGWLAELLAYLTANRDFALDFIARELPGLRCTRPDASYLLWIDCRALELRRGSKTDEGGHNGAATDLNREGQHPPSAYKFFLEEAKVALNDGATFGTGGAGFVRLNFGCPRSLLAEALERMSRAIR